MNLLRLRAGRPGNMSPETYAVKAMLRLGARVPAALRLLPEIPPSLSFNSQTNPILQGEQKP